MTCAKIIKQLPIKTPVASLPVPEVSPMLATPTTATPMTTKPTANHWYMKIFRLRKTHDKSAVNTTTDPRSIWKTDAYERHRPEYMMPVPHMSQQAGRANQNDPFSTCLQRFESGASTPPASASISRGVGVRRFFETT